MINYAFKTVKLNKFIDGQNQCVNKQKSIKVIIKNDV